MTMMVFAMRKSRLSWSIQRRLIEHFVSGSTARTAACLVDVNKSTAAFYFQRLREIIALQSEDTSPLFGEIEVDESYFGGHRKGKTLKAIIEDKVVPDSIVYSDTFRSYDVLDISNFKHLRINHSELFSDHSNHINGIENFWNQAKRHMRRFNGIPAAHFHLYLKECEWRFNSPQPKKQQAQLIQWAKTYLR